MKKNMIFIVTILFSLIIQSCSNEKKKDKNKSRDYCAFIFESKLKKVYVSDDGCFVTEWTTQKDGKNREVNTNLNFTKKERDSVVKYASRIINHPTIADTMLTCYAGENIEIEISYCTTSVMCKYSSVPSWSTLSEDNKKLYVLLNSKTKIPK